VLCTRGMLATQVATGNWQGPISLARDDK